MNSDTLRLMLRYTAISTATPSMAWPVWLMVVVMTKDRSGSVSYTHLDLYKRQLEVVAARDAQWR